VALLAPTSIDRLGTAKLSALAAAATVGGDTFVSTGYELLYINNASVGDITLTIAIQYTVDTEAVASRTVVIKAGANYLLGVWAPGIYGDSTGTVYLTYSGVTTLTVAIVKFTGL
jgi:hypothetical protein